MTEDSTQKFVKASLNRANEALRAAHLLLKSGEFKDSVSRAYYAMFHAARALLNQKGVTAKTHKGTQQMFDLHIIKNNVLSRKYGELFRKAFNQRQKSDYEVYTKFNKNEAEETINNSEDFVKTIEKLLK